MSPPSIHELLQLTVTPRNGEGIMGEEGEALSRNMCKGPMDKAKEG